MDSLNELDLLALENFRTYLRIPSVHPNINYDECVKFLEKQAKDIGLDCNIYWCVPDNPMIILTWLGKEANLSTILLSSHMDVVPVFEEKWIHKPFGAEIDDKGDIYARGAQDTKCIGIQYLEAIRRLKRNGVQPRRTIHVCFNADEETGGLNGMIPFVTTNEFQKLNIGFALDEGRGGENNVLKAYYGEKEAGIHCTGQPGHGSMLLANTAGDKVRQILDKIYDFRAEQKKIEQEMGTAVTSINLTMVRGGVQNNVIPAEFILVFDTRTPVEKFDQFETLVRQWCKEVGENISITDLVKDKKIKNSDISDSNAFLGCVENYGYKLNPLIYTANTDARHLRSVGIQAIGFTPNQNTENRVHGDNEFLNIKVFLEGIKVYEKIIPAIGNV